MSKSSILQAESDQANLPTLNRISSIQNSKDFLEECTYFIGLTDLYKLHSTCHYNEGMPYCPVQVQIVSPDIQKSYGDSKFLLQVWKRLGKKVFQRELQAPVSLWTICFNYFLYRPSTADANSDYIHIVDLKDPEKVYLVQDFVGGDSKFNQIAFAKNLLYLASEQEIKVAEVVLNPEAAHVPIGLVSDDIFTIKLENASSDSFAPCKLLGIYLNSYKEGDISVVTAIETLQCQVDFSFLNVDKSNSINDDGQKFTYTLSQFREVIKQPSLKSRATDLIVKFDAVIQAKSKFIVGCALRKSGAFDIYYNGFRVSSSPEGILAHDVEITYDTVYLEMKSDLFLIEIKERIGKRNKFRTRIEEVIKPVEEEEQRVRAIHHHWENKMNYENSEYDPHFTFKSIFYQRIKNSCNIFNSFNLIGTVLAVAHGKMISIYSILTQRYIKLFTFDSEVVSIFRSTGKNAYITVLLANNKLRIIRPEKKVKNLLATDDNDQEPWVEVDSKEINLSLPPGKVAQYAFDLEDNKYVLFLVTNGSKSTLICLFDNQLYDITEQIHEFGDNKERKNNLFFLFSDSEITEFVLQIGRTIHMYSIKFIEDKPDDLLQKEAEEAEKVVDADEEEEGEGEKEEKKVELNTSKNAIQLFPMKPVVDLHKTIHNDHIHTILTFGIKYSLKIHHSDTAENADGEKKEKKKEVNEEKLKKKLEEKAENSSYLIVGDHHSFYKIMLRSNACTVFPNQNVIGMYFSDKNYLYTLAHRSNEKRAGFRLYDIENVVEHNKDFSYTLSTSVQVGCQGFIDYSNANQRIVFQANFEKIEVVPLLHRNTVAFIGMKPRQEFLGAKVINGKLYALSVKGKLQCWDLLTGKPLQFTWQNKELSQYEVYAWGPEDQSYKKEWFDKILLRKKVPVQVDESEFFGAKDKNIKGQVSYIDKQPKQFYQFKLIEIQESGVKDHFNFVFPQFSGVMQYMFFSQDLKTLYVRLKYERQFLYSRKDIDSIDGATRVQWEIQHRFNSIPVDLMNITQYPYLFSPNFTKYIDVDNSHTNFVIRSSDKKETVLATIPDRLMSSQLESLHDQASRFRWIDENTIYVINQQGIERLIDLTDNQFREIEFNFIPLYDRTYCKKKHYVLDPPAFEQSDTLGRLHRKYNQYKSNYYLFNAQERAINGTVSEYLMNKSLFCIDYSVDKYTGRYVADLSFTFLHWSLMEQLGQEKITFDQIDTQQVEHLFYNILPKGNTILHVLHNRGELLEQLMQIAHPDAEDRTKIGIHVPLLPNFEGKSAFHLCAEGEEYRYINMFLEYLQGYNIDHHSRAIVDELHVCVEHDLPNLIPYLESRVKQTDMIKKITKGMLRVTNKDHVCASQVWTTQEDIDQLLQPAPIEQDIKLFFLDVPEIHSFNTENAENFFTALSETENMKFFETHGVKKLIEFKWPLIFEFTVVKLFIPFVLFLSLFLVMMHTQCFLADKRDQLWAQGVFIGIIVLALYLLAIELYQLIQAHLEYFLSFWNYLDFIPPIMILIFLFKGVYQHEFDEISPLDDPINMEINLGIRTHKAIIQSIISLLIWLKFLYFLRIFRATSYLIRIIIEVCIDMKYFLFVLLLTFIAFGDAVYYINHANAEPFIGGNGGYVYGILFIYRMVLGDFATDAFGTIAVELMLVFFVLCTVFNMIIMLNLLIAIISESFARINEEKEQAGYQERARFISENLYLVPKYRRDRYCLENRYLLFAVDQQIEMDQHVETIDEKLKDLKKGIKSSVSKIASKLKGQIKKSIKKNANEIKTLIKGDHHEHEHENEHGHDHGNGNGHGHQH